MTNDDALFGYRLQLFELGSAYGPAIDRSIEWWGQFEAFHALQLMDELFGRESDRYKTAFAKAWALARDAFADPRYPGVCPRMDEKGEVRCDSIRNLDLSIFKNTPIREQVSLQFRTEFFNVFNHTNFGGPNTNLNSGLFGRITSAGASREVQFGLKLLY